MRFVFHRPCSGTVLVLALMFALACGGAPEQFSVDSAQSGNFPEAASAEGWPRWGGPRGDFTVPAAGLATAWPESPAELWSRELGEGYSAVVVARGVAVTLFRDGDEDVVIALRADDGSQVWSHRYEAPTRDGNNLQFGKGPNATPVIVGDKVVTLGYTGILRALNFETGEALWSHNLLEDFGGEVLGFGYSASPIEHDGKVIVLVGGNRGAVAAFDPASGELAWRSAGGTVSYATPIVIDVDGQKQIVYLSADEIFGLDAASGRSLWSHPC
jgi:outer membrane protein assembly factor BamB